MNIVESSLRRKATNKKYIPPNNNKYSEEYLLKHKNYLDMYNININKINPFTKISRNLKFVEPGWVIPTEKSISKNTALEI